MNGDMQSIRQKLSEAQNLLGTIHELLPPEQPAPALPPLPDLSGHPGFALHMEGGKPEIRKPELEKDWFWEYDMPVRRLFGSVPPLVYILDYFPPPDVPANER